MDGRTKKEQHILVLINTSLDTHIGLSLTPDTTAEDLKRMIENEHPSLCPHVGAITVNAIKVERRHKYFHLTDSVPVISVFQGLVRKNWSLYVDATRRSNQSDKLKVEVGSGREKAENCCEDREGKHTESSEKRNTQKMGSPEEVADGIKRSGHSFDSDAQARKGGGGGGREEKICSPEKVEGCGRSSHSDDTHAHKGRGKVVVGATPKSEAAGQKLCSPEKVVVDISKGSERASKEERLLRTSSPLSTPKSDGMAAAPAASVTGLITRYFPAECDEVKSCHSPSESHGSCEGWYPQEPVARAAVWKKSKSNAVIIHRSNRAPAPAAVGNKLRARSKTQVGNRVLQAGNHIAASSKKKSPVAMLCQSKRRKMLSACNPRALAFEISDSV